MSSSQHETQQRWWDVWDNVCVEFVPDYDLGAAVLQDGRTALACWQDGAVVRIVVDRPLAECLMAQDAGFLVGAALRHGLTRFVRQGGGVVTVAMDAHQRQRRRQWLMDHPVSI